ncbi:hypothetical protein PHET_09210 [Paragonimus heterotremus]|uniref:MIT domain-containing protein n=1 Tax=Paragonimus heterotremus TaxID=100268 RepID=A0A8J4WNN7_9TREM|nr:hypothetical protein PHET_09210 [Paragonimus heterotremus]
MLQLNHLEQAHELEKVCNWKSAYESYLRGLSYLVAAVEYEISPKPREELKQLTVQCFKQAEIIKARLKNERECDSRPVRPPVSAKFVSPSSTSVSETYFKPTTIKSVAQVSTSRTAPPRPPLPPSLSYANQSVVHFTRNSQTKPPKTDVQSPEPSSSSLMGYLKSFFYSNSASSGPSPQLESQTSALIETPTLPAASSAETNDRTGPRELPLDADVSSEKHSSTAQPFGSIASASQDPLANNFITGCLSFSDDSVPEVDSESNSSPHSSDAQCLEEPFQPLVPGKHIPGMSSFANQQPKFFSPCPNSHPHNEASKDVMPTLLSSAPGLSQLSSTSSVHSLPADQLSADSNTAGMQCSMKVAPALTGESASYEALSATVTNPDKTLTDFSSHPPSKSVDGQDTQPPIEMTKSMCDSSEKQYLDVLDNVEDFYALVRFVSLSFSPFFHCVSSTPPSVE